jgi:hypothetical protein
MLSRLDTTEMEFSLPSHMVLMFPDGIPAGCEWHNNHEAGKLSVVAPNTVLFNPAGEYLFFRKKKSHAQCRVLLLAIAPTILSRVNGSELTDIHFSQHIGLDDPIICQALIAIQQEIESPGLNSKSYLDTLLMLLLNGAARQAQIRQGWARSLAAEAGRPAPGGRFEQGAIAVGNSRDDQSSSDLFLPRLQTINRNAAAPVLAGSSHESSQENDGRSKSHADADRAGLRL